ncbi:MAG: AtpZ/AtpI family protein [Phycisphaerae bacterium]|nr:AtpZ/AtpI family protein [Phycisphaerae bacterium]
MPHATVGMEFIITVGLLTGGGIWLDSRYDTLPLWTLVGFVLGFAGGLYRLIRAAKAVSETKKSNDPGEDDSALESKRQETPPTAEGP